MCDVWVAVCPLFVKRMCDDDDDDDELALLVTAGVHGAIQGWGHRGLSSS